MNLFEEQNYGYIGVVGKETETPSQGWLDMQEITFADDAVFVSFYPVSGGAMTVDKSRLTNKGEATQAQQDTILGKHSFNPAAETVAKLQA